MQQHILLRLTAALLVALAPAVSASAAPSPDELDLSGEFRAGAIVVPRQAKSVSFFTQALGGAKAEAVTQSSDPKRPFEVDGETFTDFPTAANRVCDNQHNACAQLANNKTGDFTVGQCDQQSTQCKSAAASTTDTGFQTLVSSTADFDIFCDA